MRAIQLYEIIVSEDVYYAVLEGAPRMQELHIEAGPQNHGPQASSFQRRSKKICGWSQSGQKSEFVEI